MARARTAAIDESAEIAEPAPPKRRGRPRTKPEPPEPGEITPEMEQAAATGAELDRNAEMDFFELLRAYDPLEWERGGLFMYLFRTAPVIDRGRTGNDFNIQKFTRPTDTDEIMRASYGGSGGYKLKLIRWNANTRQSVPIRQEYFRILHYDFPPRIPFGEWIDSDNNKEWAWAKPKLQALARQEAAAEKAAEQVAGAPATSEGPVLELLRELLPAGRKNEAQTIAAEVVQAIEREKPKTSAGLESIVLRLLERDNGGGENLAALRLELSESRKRADDLMMKMLERATAAPASAAPPSILQQLKELAEAKTVLGSIFGRGGGTAADKSVDWPEVGLRVAEKLIETAPQVMQAFALGKQGIKQPARRAAEVAAGVSAAPANVVRDVETAEEVQEMIANISKQFGPMFDEVTPFLSNYFLRGVSGMEFRDWFIQEYGRRSYDGLRQLHPQTIGDVIELRKTEAPTDSLRAQLAQLAPKEKVLHFIAQFLSDEPSEFSEDEETAGDDIAQPAAGLPAAGTARSGGGF